MPRIARFFEFDAGHRVWQHEGKCKHLHGHRYKVEVVVDSAKLDRLGMVLDFARMKLIVGGWIDQHLDHNMIIHPEDSLMTLWNTREDEIKEFKKGESVSMRVAVPGLSPLCHMIGCVFGYRKPFVMPPGRNPTAENIAQLLYDVIEEIMAKPLGVTLHKVKVWETPNCYADCYGHLPIDTPSPAIYKEGI